MCIIKVMFRSWSKLDQTLIEVTSLPKRELNQSGLNQLLEESDLVLLRLLLTLLVDSS